MLCLIDYKYYLSFAALRVSIMGKCSPTSHNYLIFFFKNGVSMKLLSLIAFLCLNMSAFAVQNLDNYLGKDNPRLQLLLSANGPGWAPYPIDYQQSGQVPWSANPIKNYSSWNVVDTNVPQHNYGTITLTSDGSNIAWAGYVSPSPATGYYLKGINFCLPFSTNSKCPSQNPNYSLTVDAVITPQQPTTPPIITNSGWNSGMGNTNGSFVAGDSFWVQDYGINEANRWTIDQMNQSIKQSTDNMNGNYGSRAYPVVQNSNGIYTTGIGSGFDGVWQIDMKLGSNGQGPFCETFYLAERKNLAPGPANYIDGSGSAVGGNGREIDIMETQWKPFGPQVNLANGGETSWNTSGVYQSKQMGAWADLDGGIPTKDFVTFGAFIKDQTLWLYAYKPDGTQWYSSDAIPLSNPTYTQTSPFVPYIGTWTTGSSSPGNFVTEYKNFIYSSASAVSCDCNPKDNPDEFMKAVKKAAAKLSSSKVNEQNQFEFKYTIKN